MPRRFTSTTILVGDIEFRNGVRLFDGTVAHTNGTTGTGAGKAGPGSLYFRTDGRVSANIGTKASPVWGDVLVGTSAESPSKSPSASVSPSVSVSPSASKSPSSSVSLSKSPSASTSPSTSVSPS